VLRIRGQVQTYPWGSKVALPRLLGVSPNGRPVAEIWYGAHPAAPSTVLDPAGEPDATLDRVLTRHPMRLLGEEAVTRHGATMPFLVKLLAAAHPLSLQVHPDEATARAGFTREEALGVAPADRNYRDPHAKPETLIALEPTHALAGFRRPEDAAADLAHLVASPDEPLVGVVEALRGPGPAHRRVEAGLRGLLALDPRHVTEVLDRLADRTDAPGRPVRWGDHHLAIAREVATAFPGDQGVLSTVLLNAVSLAEGEALDIGAGIVHCYVQGTGLEVMGASDNVLRAGLTDKRVDVPELLRVVDLEPTLPQVVRPTSHDEPGARIQDYATASSSYHVQVVEPHGVWTTPGATGPRTVVVLSGRVRATGGTTSDGDVAALRPGDAVVVEHGAALTLEPAAPGVPRVAVVGLPRRRRGAAPGADPQRTAFEAAGA